jgi:glucokinase
MAWYAGVDIGATNIRALVGDESGTVYGTHKRETPQGPSGIAVTEAVLETLRSACTGAEITPTDIVAAGVGSIGPLDRAEGTVINPANLPDVIDTIPLTGPIENLIDGPVSLHNDANAGVIGERFYADHNPDNMIYLTISTGIGAGVIVDGTVLSGWDGNAGEVGHIALDSDGVMPCGCGKRGHWEAYCSGENIPLYAKELYDGQETALSIDDPELSAADVFALAGEDEFVDHVIERVTEWNAQGVASLVHAYAPIVIYIGGAVALNNPELVVERLRDVVPDLVMTNVPDIRLTTLGDDVVVKGALASAINTPVGETT